MISIERLEAMDLEKAEDFSEDRKGYLSASCSICLDLVLDRGGRSIAKLLCGHEFHLDCIGSAFNAKGAMQCPNCRKIEKGRWLYANGYRSTADSDLEAWVTEDFYDLNYPDLPFGLQWCPFSGITQLASLFEEGGESQLSSFHHDHSSSSNGRHLCPFMALQGFPHPFIHGTPPSSSGDSVPDSSAYPRRLTNLGGQPSSDMPNYTSVEPQNLHWQQQQQQQHSLPFSFSSAADQSAPQFNPRVSRNDSSSQQQRSGSFAHPHSLSGSGPRSSSNLVSTLGTPVMGEVRAHAHTRGHGSNHIYQHSAPSSSLRSSPAPAIRRSRPREYTLVSSVAATTAIADVARAYGFTSASDAANRGPQDSENIAHQYDRFYGWGGRESLTPLPWIPLDESQWWSPFNPNQAPQPGGSFLQRANTMERPGQSRAENGYQRLPARMPPPPRMPPSSYM